MVNVATLVWSAGSLALCLACRSQAPPLASNTETRLDILAGRSVGEIRAMRQPGEPVVELDLGPRTTVGLLGGARHAEFLARLEAHGFSFNQDEPKTRAAADLLSDAEFDSARTILDFVGGLSGASAADHGASTALSIPWQVLEQGANLESLIAAARSAGTITPEAEARVRAYLASRKTNQ